ncbi:MAG: TIGR00159 family protein [Erysipelotrichaceae bacterium]|nr:TIGR00159 family protein [Erysipelotrichaceae bacterium]
MDLKLLLTVSDYFNTSYGWADFAIAAIISGLLLVYIYVHVKRWIPRLIYTLGVITLLGASLLGLRATSMILVVVLVLTGALMVITNAGEFRGAFSNQLKGQSSIRPSFLPKRARVKKIYDKDELYHEVAVAVEHLSKTKTGAIITFEKTTPLNDVIKNGTLVNAPVSSEIIETIFYVGTRLHDGAIVIRDDTILAASVYYTATTKPLNGKFGSRHRAAIGISEITDSITVVVSEETGRISIAAAGELETVGLDNFLRVFREHMEE